MNDWRENYYFGNGRSNRIRSDWKRAGLIDNARDVYQIYKDTDMCTICDIPLSEDCKATNNKKVMDHCHQSGHFRSILCWSCNIHEHFNTFKYMDILNRNLTSFNLKCAEEDHVTDSKENPTEQKQEQR